MIEEIHPFVVNHLVDGAVSIVVVEDDIAVADTILHNEKLGFTNVIIVSKTQPVLEKAPQRASNICWFSIPSRSREDIRAALNSLITALEGRWVYYGYNAELLFFPFQEDRMINDLARFMEEERRTHVFAHVIDIYTPSTGGIELDLSQAHFDAAGYFAMNRFADGVPIERQIEIFGGLKWRYSEHVPWDRQRIDRVPFFKACKGLELDRDFRLSEPEMNTYACPWHHNVTCAIASYRTAKSLRRNPGSSSVIESFMWAQSVPFEGHSKQFMDLGMMEPGQWF